MSRKSWVFPLDDNPEEWICECGEKLDITNGKWRWDGKNWQHYHGYPIGHVIVERKKIKKEKK